MNTMNALTQLNKASTDLKQELHMMNKVRWLSPSRFEKFGGEQEVRHIQNELRAVDFHFNRIAKTLGRKGRR